MPAQRPRASFDPIPPDLDLEALVEQTPNFQFVDRISCDMIDQQGLEEFDKLVYLHVVLGGKPLVIDGYQSRLDPWTFSSKWLQDNCGGRVEEARDLRKEFSYTPLTVGHYLRNMSKLGGQYFEKQDNFRDLSRQRVYLKDIDCPEVWHDKLREHLPPSVFYLNDTIGEIGGPGSVDEPAPGGKRKGKGIAIAGDLMSCLPPPMRAENMMCYIGHEGTYTPAHREMCASLGHNIMVETSDVLGDDGKPERPGSSIWFMTESKDRHMVSEYWLSILGHDIEVEKHFAQILAWKKAPFTTYVVEQKAGDFILIPPLAPHQVWNRGTRTMKAAWNRTTIETLELAFNEALPNARMVCRDEQYKNKAIVYFTLQKYSTLLAKERDQTQTAPTPEEARALWKSPRIRQVRKDFKKLFKIMKDILLSEMFAPDSHEKVQFMPFDSNITCAYCRGNIFNRFLSCPTCEDVLGTTEPEPYDICMDCYAMGRSCGCISKLRWSEQFKWKELTQKYEIWRKQYQEIEGDASKPDSPLTLQEERQRLSEKTLAQVCQEQLKRRPWVDVRKRLDADEEESDIEEIKVNDEGQVVRTKKRHSEAWLKNHHACHVCAHRHEKWKMAECKCGKWWCYGTLFRGHDLMPLQVMQDPAWQCPHCKLVCNAGSCRKDPRQKPHDPKGTLLGHDTKKVADARSVESLVDFSVSNLNWLQETTKAPKDNARLKRRQEEAEANKLDDPMEEQYGTDEDENPGIEYSLDDVESRLEALIDPSLRESGGVSFTAVNRPSASSIPAVSALLNGDNNQASPAGYKAARQSGFVAPTAVMGQSSYDLPPNEQEFPSRSLPLDTGEIITEPSKGKKRTSSMTGGSSAKVPRLDDNIPVSGATKQYRKEKERHALEEARKKGSFILTHAKLRRKSRIITLNVGREKLASILSATGVGTDGVDENDLLRSDVQPAEPEKRPNGPAPAQNLKAGKAVRIRIEKDDDFGARKRGQKSAGATTLTTNRKSQNPSFEEVEIESDTEAGVDAESQLDGALESTNTGHKKRRTSAWQNKRQEAEMEELPEELPEDWNDGKAGKSRDRANVGKMSLPASTSKQVSAGRDRPQNNQTNGSNITGEKSAVVVNDPKEERLKNVELAKAALQRGQGSTINLKSKNVMMSGGEQDDSDDEDDVDEGSMSGVKPVASLVSGAVGAVRAVASGSIFSRQSPGGKKIKIVGKRKT